MNAAHQAQLEALTTAELVALYNNNVPAEKAIKKFADRATAVKRLLALLPENSIFWNKAAEVVPSSLAGLVGALVSEPTKAVAKEKAPRKEKPAKTEPVWPFATTGAVKKEEKKAYNPAARLCPKCGMHDQVPAGEEGTVAGEQRSFCNYCMTEYWVETGKEYKAPKESASRSVGIRESWHKASVAAARSVRDNVLVDGKPYKSVRAAFMELGFSLAGHIKFRMALKKAGKLTYETLNKKFAFEIVKG